jgi:hypothetical protein
MFWEQNKLYPQSFLKIWPWNHADFGSQIGGCEAAQTNGNTFLIRWVHHYNARHHVTFDSDSRPLLLLSSAEYVLSFGWSCRTRRHTKGYGGHIAQLIWATEVSIAYSGPRFYYIPFRLANTCRQGLLWTASYKLWSEGNPFTPHGCEMQGHWGPRYWISRYGSEVGLYWKNGKT